MNALTDAERMELADLANICDDKSCVCGADPTDLHAAVEQIITARLDEYKALAVAAVRRAKPPHLTRDYTRVDEAYDNAARIVRDLT